MAEPLREFLWQNMLLSDCGNCAKPLAYCLLPKAIFDQRDLVESSESDTPEYKL